MAEILIARRTSVFRKVTVGLVISGVIALGVHTVLSPHAIPVAQSVSPNGRWLATDVEYVPEFAVGFLEQVVGLQRRFLGFAFPPRVEMVVWAEGETDEASSFVWNADDSLSVSLPAAAKGWPRSTEYQSVRVANKH